MTCKVLLVLLAMGVTAVVAKPHVISLEPGDLDVLEEVLPLLRRARSLNLPVDEIVFADRPVPTAQGKYSTFDSVVAASAHSPHGPHSDHVDYGAYTGKHGAFGWYTDHPVYIGHGHRGGYHRR